MNCNLVVESKEITIRGYTLVEDEGLIALIGSRPELTFEYEGDQESPGRHMLVVKGDRLESLLNFLSFSEILVKII